MLVNAFMVVLCCGLLRCGPVPALADVPALARPVITDRLTTAAGIRKLLQTDCSVAGFAFYPGVWTGGELYRGCFIYTNETKWNMASAVLDSRTRQAQICLADDACKALTVLSDVGVFENMTKFMSACFRSRVNRLDPYRATDPCQGTYVKLSHPPPPLPPSPPPLPPPPPLDAVLSQCSIAGFTFHPTLDSSGYDADCFTYSPSSWSVTAAMQDARTGAAQQCLSNTSCLAMTILPLSTGNLLARCLKSQLTYPLRTYTDAPFTDQCQGIYVKTFLQDCSLTGYDFHPNLDSPGNTLECRGYPSTNQTTAAGMLDAQTSMAQECMYYQTCRGFTVTEDQGQYGLVSCMKDAVVPPLAAQPNITTQACQGTYVKKDCSVPGFDFHPGKDWVGNNISQSCVSYQPPTWTIETAMAAAQSEQAEKCWLDGTCRGFTMLAQDGQSQQSCLKTIPLNPDNRWLVITPLTKYALNTTHPCQGVYQKRGCNSTPQGYRFYPGVDSWGDLSCTSYTGTITQVSAVAATQCSFGTATCVAFSTFKTDNSPAVQVCYKQALNRPYITFPDFSQLQNSMPDACHGLYVQDGMAERSALGEVRRLLLSPDDLHAWDQTRDHCLAWNRVQCVNSRVQLVDLSNLGLTGTIPGQVGAHLAELTSLTEVNLNANQLSDFLPQLPAELTSLTLLDLGSNKLAGSLPLSWLPPNGLRSLYLNDNPGLVGDVPSRWMETVNNLHIASNPKMCGPVIDRYRYKGTRITVNKEGGNVSTTGTSAECTGKQGMVFPGHAILATTPILSPQGRFFLQYELDGNLVLYRNVSTAGAPFLDSTSPLWSTNTQSTHEYGYAVLTTAGALELFARQDGAYVSYWSNGTTAATRTATPPFQLQVQDSGQIAILDASQPQQITWVQGTPPDSPEPGQPFPPQPPANMPNGTLIITPAGPTGPAAGVIVGAVLGSLAGLTVLALLGWWGVRKWRHRSAYPAAVKHHEPPCLPVISSGFAVAQLEVPGHESDAAKLFTSASSVELATPANARSTGTSGAHHYAPSQVSTPGPSTTTVLNEVGIAWESIQIGSVVGEGGFGTVTRGTWQKNAVAVKMLNLKQLTSNARDELRQEALAMCALRHPCIAQVFGLVDDGIHTALVMRYYKRGTVSAAIHKPEYLDLSTEQRLKMCLQVASGMCFLHERLLLHGDLKTSNLLIEDDGRSIVLADFGLSGTAGQAVASGALTVIISPPEVLQNPTAPRTMAGDVYAFGIVLLEILSGVVAYRGIPSRQVKELVCAGRRPAVPDYVPASLERIIVACWAQDPASRPTFVQVMRSLEAAYERQGSSGLTDAAIQPQTSITRQALTLADLTSTLVSHQSQTRKQSGASLM